MAAFDDDDDDDEDDNSDQDAPTSQVHLNHRREESRHGERDAGATDAHLVTPC